MIGNPSKSDYKGMVRGSMIQNCPVTLKDITNARAIFSPNLASIREKMVQRTLVPVVMDYVNVPRLVVETNRVVPMAAVIFFVDGMVLLITISWRIKFITAEYLQVKTSISLCKHLEWVRQVYARARFVVRTILMYGEFEKVKNCLSNIECNTTAAKEHVSEAEWAIRTIKEQVRDLIGTLPFKDIPRQMKIEFIYFVVLWLNAFSVKIGILAAYSPQEFLVR